MSDKFDPSEVQSSLSERLAEYKRIRDCIAGSDAIKAQTTTYLPQPDPDNTTEANTTRYLDYLARAIFYNITGKTVAGLVGLAFSKDIPTLEIPKTLEFLKENINGSGIHLDQQIKDSLGEVVSLGRCGLLVDYSKNKAETQQDVLTGRVRPSILLYEAEEIVWVETKQYNSEIRLSLVILKDYYRVAKEDGYKTEIKTQYKVLLLNESGYYQQEIWREDLKQKAWVLHDIITPTDNKGNLFDHITFTFIGSKNNDSTLDDAPMSAIADLNIGHYRNSADAEESSFIHGQPTLVVTGLTKDWVSTILKGKVRIGSRGGLPLPEGASAAILHVESNGLPVEGMRDKEKQMTAIGARLVTDTTGSKTATEVNRDSNVENSELSSMVNNVELAYKFCFKQIELFTGVVGFEIELCKKFSSVDFDPTVYTALVNGTMQGVGKREDVFNYLKNTNMIEQEVNYEEWEESIVNTMPRYGEDLEGDEDEISDTQV